MRTSRGVLLLTAILALLLAGCQKKPAVLGIVNAWARPAQAGDNGAVYFVINNPTDQPDTLLSVTTPLDAQAELHKSSMDANGVMMMEPQENVPVPANSTVEFKPGGLHVMLVGLTTDLKVGDTIKITLNFEKAGNLLIEVPIRDTPPTPLP